MSDQGFLFAAMLLFGVGCAAVGFGGPLLERVGAWVERHCFPETKDR